MDVKGIQGNSAFLDKTFPEFSVEREVQDGNVQLVKKCSVDPLPMDKQALRELLQERLLPKAEAKNMHLKSMSGQG